MISKINLPITKPVLGDEEIKQVRRVIKSGWVTQGPEVEAFENEFKLFVNAKHALALSSCTAALHLALKSVGVGLGDEVITVSHSFIATANSIRYCGAVPVFVDIEPETYNMNPDLLKAVITKKTKAILCVHQMGMPCDIKKIINVAKKYKIPVVEDAACALGSEIYTQKKWEKIGRPHGDIACFSFHPRKVITTGEGGMIATNKKKYYENIRLWRQHSMSISDNKRHNTKNIIIEEYLDLGYNYRMTDIQAAIGRVQLKRLQTIIKRRRELASNYYELFRRNDVIILPYEPEWAKSNWQSFCIRLSSEINRKKLMQKLLQVGIATKKGIMCSHLEPAYNKEKWNTGDGKQNYAKLIYSEKATRESILIPFYPKITKLEQKTIVQQLISLITNC